MTISEQAILDYIAAHPGAGREDIRRKAAPGASPATIWRHLKALADSGRLEMRGKGRATGYVLAGASVVRAWLQTPYNQRKPAAYNKEFIDRYLRPDLYLFGLLTICRLCLGISRN